MENITLTFKTTLNCGNCVSKVQKDLDHLVGTGNWSVDTQNPEKILQVISDDITAEEVIDIVQSKGFQIEEVK